MAAPTLAVPGGAMLVSLVEAKMTIARGLSLSSLGFKVSGLVEGL